MFQLRVVRNDRSGKHLFQLRMMGLESGWKVLRETWVYDELLRRVYDDFDSAAEWYAFRLKRDNKEWHWDNLLIDKDGAIL